MSDNEELHGYTDFESVVRDLDVAVWPDGWEARLRDRHADLFKESGGAANPEVDPSATAPVVVSLAQRRESRRNWMLPLSAAAACLVLVVAAGVVFRSIFQAEPTVVVAIDKGGPLQDGVPGTPVVPPPNDDDQVIGPPDPPAEVQSEPTVTLRQGEPAEFGFWYSVKLDGFDPGASVDLQCEDSVDESFWLETIEVSDLGSYADPTLCYSGDKLDTEVAGRYQVLATQRGPEETTIVSNEMIWRRPLDVAPLQPVVRTFAGGSFEISLDTTECAVLRSVSAVELLSAQEMPPLDSAGLSETEQEVCVRRHRAFVGAEESQFPSSDVQIVVAYRDGSVAVSSIPVDLSPPLTPVGYRLEGLPPTVECSETETFRVEVVAGEGRVIPERVEWDVGQVRLDSQSENGDSAELVFDVGAGTYPIRVFAGDASLFVLVEVLDDGTGCTEFLS